MTALPLLVLAAALLQAEDDVSHQSWVDAIRTEIEHLLSAGSGRRLCHNGSSSSRYVSTVCLKQCAKQHHSDCAYTLLLAGAAGLPTEISAGHLDLVH
jgi:hypothetical protein